MAGWHSHPCGGCGTPTPCDGSLERNDDGFPATICALYHLPFGEVNPDCRCESCAAADARESDPPPTSDLHEVGAAVIYGLDLFCAVRLAFHQENWSTAREVWKSLTHAQKQRYIDDAAVILEMYRPHAPGRVGQTFLCTCRAVDGSEWRALNPSCPIHGEPGRIAEDPQRLVIGAITPKES